MYNAVLHNFHNERKRVRLVLKNSNLHQHMYKLTVRYGRNYWSIPRFIRSKLRFSDSICDLPNAKCWYKQSLVTVDSSRIVGENYLLGREYVSKNLFYAVVQHCTLRGPNATPCFTTGEILTTSYRDTPILIKEDLEILGSNCSAVTNDSISSEHCVLSMIGRLDSNFYHWVTEYLPLLDVFMRYCNEAKLLPTILLRENAPSFHTESIRLFCPKANIIHYVPDTQIPKLFVSTVPTVGFACHPIASQLRKQVIPQQNKNFSSTKLYLYRPVGSWRYVVNHTEVIEKAISYGFQPINPSDFSFLDQIDIFSNATDIVSIHGSALTNILYGNGCNVVEFHGDYHDSVFSSLSNLCTNKHNKVRVADRSGNVELSAKDIDYIFTLR